MGQQLMLDAAVLKQRMAAAAKDTNDDALAHKESLPQRVQKPTEAEAAAVASAAKSESEAVLDIVSEPVHSVTVPVVAVPSNAETAEQTEKTNVVLNSNEQASDVTIVRDAPIVRAAVESVQQSDVVSEEAEIEAQMSDMVDMLNVVN